MPRAARIIVTGAAHHVTQRGNNRQRVFHADGDRRFYLELLTEESDRHGLQILAFCLMDNHVHLVAVPEGADSLALALGRTHFRFAQASNARHHRSGHLWQSRFFSCVLEGPHFWRTLRYVERNPVRCGLVRRAWNYEWSSAAAHCTPADDPKRENPAGVLDLAEWDRLARGRDWRAELSMREEQEEMETLRRHTQTGRPLASPAYLDRLERKLGRRLRALPIGRPPKDGQG